MAKKRILKCSIEETTKATELVEVLNKIIAHDP